MARYILALLLLAFVAVSLAQEAAVPSEEAGDSVDGRYLRRPYVGGSFYNRHPYGYNSYGYNNYGYNNYGYNNYGYNSYGSGYNRPYGAYTGGFGLGFRSGDAAAADGAEGSVTQ